MTQTEGPLPLAKSRTVFQRVTNLRLLLLINLFAIVLEFVPASLAKEVTESVDVATICIGSGPHCDGQILVLHDVISLSERAPSFAKRYADAASVIKDAVANYAEEVRKGLFPAKEHYRE